MGKAGRSPLPRTYDTLAPISRALDQSEQVQDKVQQAAAELSSVNAALKDEIANSGTLAKVELALDGSEAVEAKVGKAAAELEAVNDALVEEIDQRHDLERRLSHRDTALSKSRAQERKSRHHALQRGGDEFRFLRWKPMSPSLPPSPLE